jgi:putative aldouronate transport system substrate-binding protein
MYMKKALEMAIALTLALIMLAGCGSSAAPVATAAPTQEPAAVQPAATAQPAAPAATEEPAPAPAEPVKLSIALPLHVSDTATMDGKIMKTLMEKTNTDLTIDMWPADGAAERRNTMLADIKNLPDLFDLTAEQAFIYSAEGILEPLDELIDQYAPNIKKFMTAENTAPLRSPTDGKIYFVPQYDTINETCDITFTYRKDILDAMGEKEPTTLDEWHELFKKVKAAYPDLIILSERFPNVAYFTHSAFDMGRFMFGDFMYGMIGSEIDKGQSVFLPTTSQWKDMLTFYSELYAEGLLDPAYMTHDSTQWWNEKIAGGKVFACWTMNQGRAQSANDLAHEAGLNEVQWIVAETTKNYKTGERVVYKVANPWNSVGLALNAKISEEKKIAAIKFLDYNFTEESALMYYYGFEGEDYTLENGKPKRTQAFADNEAKRKKEGWLYGMPAWKPLDMYADLSQPAIADHYAKNGNNFISMPLISPVGDNVERLNSIMSELQPFTQTARDEFITGRRSFDDWDSYVAECEALGSAEGNGYVQEWLDAYYANIR